MEPRSIPACAGMLRATLPPWPILLSLHLRESDAGMAVVTS